ncbi:MAG: oligosaccharide flippase family protein [Pseudomonadota bacterium]
MNATHWSFILSWSRVGLNALLFLAATRVLTLTEIGLFATAFAPVRLVQTLQRSAVCDAVVMVAHRPRRWPALFVLSCGVGAGFMAIFALIGAVLSPILFALSVIPIFAGLGAVPEGILRYRMAIKALALRTVAAQSIAAVLALWLLWQGAGLWALVAFAVTSSAFNNTLALVLARWWPMHLPRWRAIRIILPKTAHLMGRTGLLTAQLPLAQLAIGLTLGPAAAGAFQIATRMLELIEAVTLSPLRYIALPRLKRAGSLHQAIRVEARKATLLGAWIWGGTIAAAQPILTLAVGADHAPAAAPILQALAPIGLFSAILMPVTQAVTATGGTRLLLGRAALTLSLSVLFLIPVLALSPIACAIAISTASVTATLWFTRRALPKLNLTLSDAAPLIPPLGAAAVMCATLLSLPPLGLVPEILFGTALYALLLTLTIPTKRSLA